MSIWAMAEAAGPRAKASDNTAVVHSLFIDNKFLPGRTFGIKAGRGWFDDTLNPFPAGKLAPNRVFHSLPNDPTSAQKTAIQLLSSGVYILGGIIVGREAGAPGQGRKPDFEGGR